MLPTCRDMVPKQGNPAEGFTAKELWESKLGAGVIGLLTNANNMLLQRSTAEWGRGEEVHCMQKHATSLVDRHTQQDGATENGSC